MKKIYADGIYEYRPGDIMEITGINRFTLIKWSNEGLIDHKRTYIDRGDRRYCNRSIDQIIHLMETRTLRKSRK